MMIRDVNKAVRILMKNPKERTQSDIEYIMPYAKNIKLFNDNEDHGSMKEESISLICEQMQFKFHKPGEFVFHYGDEGSLFYIIL